MVLLSTVVLASSLTLTPVKPLRLDAGDHAGCGTMEMLNKQMSNPDRTVLADVQIHGTISEYRSANFLVRYTKDATVDQPPMLDEEASWPLPDGTSFAVHANGTPDYIEKAARYLEYARAKYIALGYPVPSANMEVRVVETFASYSLPLIGIVLSHKASDWRLPFLVAHELFHQEEWGYFPGDVALAVVRPQNPKFYDTFATEGAAQAGAHQVFNHDYGSDIGENADTYVAETDVDFYDQAYDSSEFWLYMMEQLTTTPAGVDRVMQRFWRERAAHSTESAIHLTATAFGTSGQALIDAFRVAIAVKGHFEVDPTVAGPSRAFDFKDDGAANWEPVGVKQTLAVDAMDNLSHQQSIQEDGGAHYFRITPGTTESYVLRLSAASTDVHAQVVTVQRGTRKVTVEKFDSTDGSVNKTITIPNDTLAQYIILASADGTQPYALAFNPAASNRPPSITLPPFCAAAVPVGTPPSGRDTAAAIQMGFLMFISLLASRSYRRRK